MLYVDGGGATGAWLEKLRNEGGNLGAVLLRCLEWEWYRGTVGGSAASETDGYAGSRSAV